MRKEKADKKEMTTMLISVEKADFKELKIKAIRMDITLAKLVRAMIKEELAKGDY